jgi:ubiquinol-cytochrome c reductase cytochrome b subunit
VVVNGSAGAARRLPGLALGIWSRSRAGWIASPWFGFTGLLALALTVLLFLSGAVMSLYYSPTPGVAYDSVDYAQFSLPFGEVVRGIHVYGWNLLLVVLVVHLGRVFLAGAYRAPWQMAWVSGVGLLLVVPALIVTGDLLPWNQSGYWSTQVRLGIMASVPVLGDLLASVVRGGPHTGAVTLTRFYVLHILFLPAAFLALLAAHVYFVGWGLRADIPAEGRADGARPSLLDLANRGLLLCLIAGIGLGVLAREWPAPLGDPADLTDTSYVPKPEWWVLPLNQLVTICKGPWTVLGTVVIPGGLVASLLVLPFLDRAAEPGRGRQRRALLAAGCVGAALIALAAMSYVQHYTPTG